MPRFAVTVILDVQQSPYGQLHNPTEDLPSPKTAQQIVFEGLDQVETEYGLGSRNQLVSILDISEGTLLDP